MTLSIFPGPHATSWACVCAERSSLSVIGIHHADANAARWIITVMMRGCSIAQVGKSALLWKTRLIRCADFAPFAEWILSACVCSRHLLSRLSAAGIISISSRCGESSSGTMCDCQWSCTHRERFTGNPFSAMRKTHSIVKKIMIWKKNDRKSGK